jgi:hypothetical protein
LAGGSVSIASSNSTRPQNIRIYNQIRISRFFTGGVGSYSAEVLPATNCYIGPNVTDTEAAKINPGQFSSFCDETSWWQLPDKFNSSISFITMHSGLPFYRSYDFYIFMISLMSTAEYYYAVAESATLRSIWRSLWLEKDRPLVRKRVKDRHGYRPSLDASIDILRGLRMRCDAVENAKKLLQIASS